MNWLYRGCAAMILWAVPGLAGCNVCTPNEQIVCGCPGGDAGFQTCNQDGASYDKCICPGGSGGMAGQAGSGGSSQAGGGSGGSAQTCTDDCAPNDSWCSNNILYSCGDADADPCLDALSQGPCPPDMCDGPPTEPCGNCGTHSRTCNNTVWSDWSACTGEGECMPSSTQPCGDQGTATCSAACAWGSCEAQLCPGSPQQACGNCGTRTRTCDNGTWTSWSACAGEGPCSEGQTQPCAGGTEVCSASCTWGACVPSCGGVEGQFDVLDFQYPSYSLPGCSGDGLGKLEVSGEMTSPTVLKFYVKKEDGANFTQPAILTVYVGDGPTCSPANVPNMSKTTATVVTGQPVQEVYLTVNPYNGGWPVGETKKFWVGKSEANYPAYRASGTVSVKRVCAP